MIMLDIMAWLDERERDEYFARNPLRALTPYTQTDRVQLDAELLRVKGQARPTEVYEIFVDDLPDSDRPWLATYALGWANGASTSLSQ